MKVISLFSGCGGLDLGFENAGFEIIYANDIDPIVRETYLKNHSHSLEIRDICEVSSNSLPEADGIIGGPPCQSWSLAGSMRGLDDKRGEVFYEYLRILGDKKPKFFVAENVPGMISKRHIGAFKEIISSFEKLGYEVGYHLVDARNYGVPQERKRVFIVGYRKDLNRCFDMPIPTHYKPTKNKSVCDPNELEPWVSLKQAIGSLPEALPAIDKNKTNPDVLFPNHEYMTGSFSTIFMSRNRRRTWDECSFTIQAGGRHAPLHPSSTPMVFVETDKFKFDDEEPVVRRLSVRECARVQTFPDEFIFYYKSVADGYKMIGNAVPVLLAENVAKKIMSDLSDGN